MSLGDWLRDLFVRQWLATAGWSAGVALGVLLLAACAGTRRAGTLAVALVLGVCASYVAVAEVPELPPAERWLWVPWLLAGSLLLLLVEETAGARATVRVALEAALLGGLAWLVFRPSSVGRSFGGNYGDVLLLGCGLAALLLLQVAQARAAEEPAWRLLGGMALAVAGGAATFLRAGSVKFGEIGEGMAAAFGAVTLVVGIERQRGLGRTAVTAATLAFGGWLLAGSLNLRLSPWCGGLLLVAFASSFVRIQGSGGRIFTGATLLAAVPAALAAWLAA